MTGTKTETRRRWMGLLARATLDELEAAWAATEHKPAYRILRPAEAGLVMVRGRAGGTGGAFNLGEMTVSRCALTIDEGFTGHGYVPGCNRRQAELAALFDALLQDEARRPDLEMRLVGPVARRIADSRRAAAARTAATRVEFFTVVRGEDPE